MIRSEWTISLGAQLCLWAEFSERMENSVPSCGQQDVIWDVAPDFYILNLIIRGGFISSYWRNIYNCYLINEIIKRKTCMLLKKDYHFLFNTSRFGYCLLFRQHQSITVTTSLDIEFLLLECWISTSHTSNETFFRRKYYIWARNMNVIDLTCTFRPELVSFPS